MKLSRWTRVGRFVAGVSCALLASWLAIAVIVGLDWWTSDIGIAPSFAPLLWFPVLAIHLAALPMIGFAMGLICSFFWHPIADRVTCERWGALVVMLLFMPALLLAFAGFASLIALFPLAFVFTLVPLHRGITIGFRWWRDGYWRHFAGLANDYEREDDSKPK